MKEKKYKGAVWALNGVSYEARNKAAKAAKENKLTIGEYVETLILVKPNEKRIREIRAKAMQNSSTTIKEESIKKYNEIMANPPTKKEFSLVNWLLGR